MLSPKVCEYMSRASYEIIITGNGDLDEALALLEYASSRVETIGEVTALLGVVVTCGERIQEVGGVGCTLDVMRAFKRKVCDM